jgi:hypothetical protein
LSVNFRIENRFRRSVLCELFDTPTFWSPHELSKTAVRLICI